MGKTFGDYMREQDGKQPEKEAIPADECTIDVWANPHWRCDSIDHNDENGCSNPECFKHDPMPEGWTKFTEDVDKMWEGILGDEAEYALCENCHVSVPVEQGVTCEGCHVFFADHGKGRNNCWKNHNCGKLVTAAGFLVKEGDVLVYPSHSDEFTVMKMEGTWVKGGHARGLRRRGSHEMPILPRLMYHKETPTG